MNDDNGNHAHTPGDWKAVSEPWEDDHGWGGDDWEVHTASGERIAIMCGPQRDGSPEGNADLIAAAPETAAERDHLQAVNAELVEALEQIRGMGPADARWAVADDMLARIQEDEV